MGSFTSRPMSRRCDAGRRATEPDDANRYDPIGDEESPVKPFKVTWVDVEKVTNEEAHHTSDYDVTELVLRRGQEFKVTILTDGEFDKDQDVLRLQFSIGEQPRVSKGTMFSITPGSKIDIEEASAVVDNVDNSDGKSTISMRVALPCTAVIGQYAFVILMRRKEHDGNDLKYTRYAHRDDIFVLFNAWCKGDAVYIEDDSDRYEYVLNDSGRIWVGSYTRSRKWNFAQFESESFRSAIYLLSKANLPTNGKGNPTRVVRGMSAMVNSNDDNGVLSGNWSGNYEGGTSPTAWQGSDKILEEYWITKKPVQYGQCWVFSGVLTSVCRALGIPARSVTNFDSAHDTDASMTIDFHFKAGTDPPKPMKHLDDSVWNFHVWNEAWMMRPDLPEGYDGWQAIDSTPQEHSEGMFQCGPAPIKAIKEGNVTIGYDTKFIFAEVNGDRLHWLVSRDQSMELKPMSKRTQTSSVGTNISTKAVGSTIRNDVTDDYKYKDGTERERMVVLRVANHSTRKLDLEKALDVEYDVDMEVGADTSANADVNFKFRAKNNSNEVRTLNCMFQATAKYYTGIPGGNIGDEKRTAMTIEAGKEDTYEFSVKGADWLNNMAEDASLGLYASVTVKETDQFFSSFDSYDIEKPEIDMDVPKQAKVGEEIEVKMSFRNPLDIPLTKNSINVSGPGFKKVGTIKLEPKYEAGEEISVTVKMTPRLAGKREIMATFHSRQLVNIEGATDIEIEK